MGRNCRLVHCSKIKLQRSTSAIHAFQEPHRRAKLPLGYYLKISQQHGEQVDGTSTISFGLYDGFGFYDLWMRKNHPGMYTQPEVEAHVKKSLDLTEIQIAAAPTGGYTGTGKAASGENYKLKITQDVAKKELRWNAEGDQGDFRDGEYHFE